MGNVSYFKRGRKKLPDEQIEQVRQAVGRQVDIAIRFGITQAQVSKIKKGQRRVAKA